MDYSDIIEKTIGYPIGFAFALLAGPLYFTKNIVNTMWKEMVLVSGENESIIRPLKWHSRAVGVLEVLLYVTSILYEKPQFIGIWLILKVAGKWSIWTGENKKLGRGPYNIFLIGTALNLIYSFAGAKIILWISDYNNINLIYTIATLIITTLLGIVFKLWSKKEYSATKKSN